MEPSFETAFDVPESGACTLQLTVSTDIESASLSAERAAEAFSAAAAAGMFSVRPAREDNVFEVLARERLDDGTFRWLVSANGLWPNCYGVLLNMLEVVHRQVGPLTRVSLTAMDAMGRRIGLRDILSRSWPPRSADVPFDVAVSVRSKHLKEPVVRVTLEAGAGRDTVEALRTYFRAWDDIVVRGAFLLVIDALDEDINIDERLAAEQTYLAAPGVVEHILYEVVGDTAAIDALVNGAIRYHHLRDRLISIEVE